MAAESRGLFTKGSSSTSWVYESLSGQGHLVTGRHGWQSEKSLGGDIPAVYRLSQSSQRDQWAPQDSTVWASHDSRAPEERQALPPSGSPMCTALGPPSVCNQLLVPTLTKLMHLLETGLGSTSSAVSLGLMVSPRTTHGQSYMGTSIGLISILPILHVSSLQIEYKISEWETAFYSLWQHLTYSFGHNWDLINVSWEKHCRIKFQILWTTITPRYFDTCPIEICICQPTTQIDEFL